MPDNQRNAVATSSKPADAVETAKQPEQPAKQGHAGKAAMHDMMPQERKRPTPVLEPADTKQPRSTHQDRPSCTAEWSDLK